jgi:hypothetical protein
MPGRLAALDTEEGRRFARDTDGPVVETVKPEIEDRVDGVDTERRPCTVEQRFEEATRSVLTECFVEMKKAVGFRAVHCLRRRSHVARHADDLEIE